MVEAFLHSPELQLFHPQQQGLPVRQRDLESSRNSEDDSGDHRVPAPALPVGQVALLELQVESHQCLDPEFLPEYLEYPEFLLEFLPESHRFLRLRWQVLDYLWPHQPLFFQTIRPLASIGSSPMPRCILWESQIIRSRRF